MYFTDDDFLNSSWDLIIVQFMLADLWGGGGCSVLSEEGELL